MGLLRTLLGRRPAADPELWQPFGPGRPVEDDAYEIFGDGAATDVAYRVDFALGVAPAARLIIWAGAVEADPDTGPGPYAIDYRGEWWLNDVMIAAWVTQDPDGFSDPAQAAEVAAEAMNAYASCNPRTGDEAIPDEGYTEEFFCWDGQPLPDDAGE